MDRQVYEVVLQGYDGATDETDDKIVWIASPNKSMVQDFVKDLEVESIYLTDLPEHVAGIDHILGV